MSSPADLAAHNLATHFTWLQSRLPGARIRRDDRLTLADSGLPCDTFNAACAARLDATDAPARVGAALAWFAERAHPFSWWVCPGDTPSSLGAVLCQAGLAPAGGELAMALDLAKADVTAPLPAGLVVERVRTPEALRDFARINAANWSPPDVQVLAFYERAAALLLGPGCPLRLYLGRVDGEPVATAQLTVDADSVGLYNIATLAEWRGRGFGSALTRWPLAEARAEGHRVAILQASDDGAGIYRRIGFQAFGEIVEYQPGR
ncbi:MAG TPA: GNAT family N-acetyltransferase [Gemmatimonadales bacterium]|nr:GNAT family N-acetyltransferase [Gemmatimonadales bacterium]